jgi:nucleotide-binding universal stress UspA family protein
MLRISRVLFPTDHGEGAAVALSHAARVAGHHGARLDVLHVTGPASAGRPPIDLAQLAGGVNVELVERQRDSALRGILDYAGESDADVIVMATHARRGLDRFLIGSVAEQIVRAAECPVLTVGPRATAPAGGSRILVPVDFSAHAERALRHAAGLAEAYEAAIDLVHAVHVPALPADYGVSPLGADRTPAFVEGSRRALESLRSRYLPGTLAGDVLVEVGHPADVILAAVEERAPDLVALATHGLTGLQRLAMGSIAEYVVRRAPCAVFTVKSFGKSLLDDSADADA